MKKLKTQFHGHILLLIVMVKKNTGTLDSIYFRGKSHFKEDGAQNYLIFQPMYIFKRLVVLVVMYIFIFGNLKVCAMKELILLLHLIIVLL